MNAPPKTPPPHIKVLMGIAAGLKLSGKSWENIAVAVHRSPRTCRSWPRLYPEEWLRFLLEAGIPRIAETAGDAAYTQLVLSRSDNPWIRHYASQNLLKLVLLIWQQQLRSKGAAGDITDQQLVQLVTFVKGFNNEQLNALMDQVVGQRRLPADNGESGNAATPGPAQPQ